MGAVYHREVADTGRGKVADTGHGSGLHVDILNRGRITSATTQRAPLAVPSGVFFFLVYTEILPQYATS